MPHHDRSHGPQLADLLDLDADVLHSSLKETTAWVHELAPDRHVLRVVDLGAGTGSGSFALAEEFPGAQILAVDVSDDLLGIVRERALAFRHSNQISTVQADLNTAWPEVGAVDVIWAALSMHELTDPQPVLTGAHAALSPGGVFAVIEMDALPRFLPADIGAGRPGLDERIHAIVRETPPEGGLHPDWELRLESAGFSIRARKEFEIEQRPAASGAAGRYAHAWLSRVRSHVSAALSTQDCVALDALLASDGPHSVLTREDLHIRSSRTAWAAVVAQ